MRIALADYANELPQSTSLSDLKSYVRPVAEQSPIDEFHFSLRETLSFGTDEILNSNEFLGRLLLIGLVSAVESYIRSILSGVLTLCPVAQTSSSDKAINLGAIIWHTRDRFSRSVFDNLSLADAKALRQALKEYAGVPLPDAEFEGLLAEYEKVCQFRHGIVHANGFLPGKNALKLEIPRHEEAARVIIRFKQLQEVADVLDSLVRLINRTMFYTLCKRWAIDWRKRVDWDSSKEDILFARIWSLCVCRADLKTRRGRSRMKLKHCRSSVKQEFAIA